MRPLSLGDLTAAARVLRPLTEPQRGAMLAGLLAAADEADAHRLKTGRLHPRFGNGSLSAAAHRHPMADFVDFSDPGFCGCLILILRAYLERKGLPTGARNALRGRRIEF